MIIIRIKNKAFANTAYDHNNRIRADKGVFSLIWMLTSYDLLHSKDFQCRQKVQKMAEILRFSASFVCKGADFLI